MFHVYTSLKSPILEYMDFKNAYITISGSTLSESCQHFQHADNESGKFSMLE